GIAVPHAKIPSVSDFVVAVGRSPCGIEFDALDSKSVNLVVLIAGPDNRQARYLQILASVTLRLKKEDVRIALLDAPTRSDALEILSRPL
ncbi:MAG: PTS sugar transporter subunit IIA, partial [Planctomycetota bacterium]